MNRICGVYAIQNTITSECYVGASCNVKVRWTEHRCLLRTGMNNKRFQASFNTHGEEVFEFKLLEECSLEDLHRKELEWAYKLNPQLNNMFVAVQGEKLVWKRTEDLKREASLSVKQRWAKWKAYRVSAQQNFHTPCV